ncbi:MAG: CehA/McbA family metallohydrolase [Myxococcota bacterium]
MNPSRWLGAGLALGVALAMQGCGDDGSPDNGDPDAQVGCLPPFSQGDDGHSDPLGAGAGEARAGRVDAADLPEFPSGLHMWEGGDFALANDRVAMVIEDVGPSDLYDPWGGRPVGLARVEDGQLVEPANFGEFFILTGRTTVLTESVTVLNDGQDGSAAVVRATGPLSPLPFFDTVTRGIFQEEFPNVQAAIDYVLEPDADHVDIFVTYRSNNDLEGTTGQQLHGYMYTYRLPAFSTGVGFDTEGVELDFIGFIDDDATSYSYEVPGQTLGPGISASGFRSSFTDGYTIVPCEELERHHARITIGGPGVDGLLQARARQEDDPLREISGTVNDSGFEPAEGVRVHAETAGADPQYLTNATTDEDGNYRLHVPAGQDVQVTAYRRGDAVFGPAEVDASTDTFNFNLSPTGTIRVGIEDGDGMPLPARVQVLPAGDTALPTVPAHFGEPEIMPGRLHVEFPMDGEVEVRAPVGTWEVVVSRGFEYEHDTETVTIADAGDSEEVDFVLERVVDTTDVMCGDFHIHTIRSNDSGDDVERKVRSAVADGVELPVRSDHEYVEDFQPVIEELGLTEHAFGLASVELTSFEAWGHMGVFPLEPDASAVNGGTPSWQRYPTASQPDVPLELRSPAEVFGDVRARPEEPVVIINHPRGGVNYFDYVGYDRTTGAIDRMDDWDEEFTLVEVFNNSGWLANRDETVADWLSFLDRGRRVFAVGSSDSHHIRGTFVGYPRTCLDLGTDDTGDVTPEVVRDTLAAGHATISGGIYVDAEVAGARPGDEAVGVGESATLRVWVQAASWVDVDTIEVVVDGETALSFPIEPEDADPTDPVTRFWPGEMDGNVIEVDVDPGGSYVIVAAYGDGDLGPVHPGKAPFGVTNPIFLVP